MFKHYLINPLRTGAICSSSKKLAKVITSNINIQKVNSICEIGPGTGVFTRAIIEQKSKDSNFFTIEINSDIVHEFRKHFPQTTIYEKSATELSQVLQIEQLAYVDVIICGLPWACFSCALQDEILNAIYNALPTGGKLTSFAYVNVLPQAKRFRKKLFERFRKVELSPIVWANLPPAYVYCCTK